MGRKSCVSACIGILRAAHADGLSVLPDRDGCEAGSGVERLKATREARGL